MSESIPHDYYPPNLALPHFLPNEDTAFSLIFRFALLWMSALGAGFIIIRRVRPTASKSDQLAFLWMCLTGCIHLFFEAYFVIKHPSLAGSETLFGQLWKEYSLSDSRYLISDTFLVCMEAVTAFAWGPLAFATAYFILVRHPARHACQLILSTGQVYGDVLYYATSLLDLYKDGTPFCRPEGYYFWFYYFFMNFIWMAIGSYYATQSVKEITRVFTRDAQLDRGEEKKKR
ncbi:emopamil binding protein [Aspergillus steynii IBT 23096]|uniref:Emopamil binding protein n=1 Tax=Aspergillus steynii IBT 23096 TaxID=1392250 RepID=A0A2I2G712_9EURO|nr:emopamil binding protein [Aspergillus steynii IBT 23096]PLB48660.1 emopamil binding protein [Aspergillus steynii IBT 23096]